MRLTERLLAHDPPAAEERAALVAAIDAALAAAPLPRGAIVGIAGTVTTLAAMAQKLVVYDGELSQSWMAQAAGQPAVR